MRISAALLSIVSLVQAHYTFHSTIYNNVTSSQFEYIRRISRDGRDFPEFDVFGPNITCNRMEENPFTKMGTKTLDVTAGSTITFEAFTGIFHPGPLQFWMAKAPSGTKVSEFDGTGHTWFKIYSDTPSVVDERMRWPNYEEQRVSVKIPECVEDGEYLLRLEHIGLHNAYKVNAAQFFLSCAQINVSGGTGTYAPNDLLAFPGSYNPEDPSLVLSIWYPLPVNYVAPGGPVLKC